MPRATNHALECCNSKMKLMKIINNSLKLGGYSEHVACQVCGERRVLKFRQNVPYVHEVIKSV